MQRHRITVKIAPTLLWVPRDAPRTRHRRVAVRRDGGDRELPAPHALAAARNSTRGERLPIFAPLQTRNRTSAGAAVHRGSENLPASLNTLQDRELHALALRQLRTHCSTFVSPAITAGADAEPPCHA